MAPIRRAIEGDVLELVRLRAAFVETLHGVFETTSASANWRRNCAAVLKEQLTAATMCVLVVDSDEGIAACGYGTIMQLLPVRTYPTAGSGT